MRLTLREINRMDRRLFIDSLGDVFEASPWVAERAWSSRPFAAKGQLHQAMVRQVEAAPEADRLALLRAHPDLGRRARMSTASQAEQSGAGLDQLTAEEYETLTALNESYREKFGFPFLFAVKGSTKHQVIEALQRRLSCTRETELREALTQVYRIAGFRLDDMIVEGELS